jgi:endonuclease G
MATREQRSRTDKDQLATFLTTNLLPQTEENNRAGYPWRRLEEFSKKLVDKRNRELYTFAGGAGSANYAFPSNPLSLRGINIPEETWKVIVILEPGQGLADITADTPVIAVVTPNDNNPQPPDAPDVTQWPTWIKSVDYIEDLTGLDLLANLPDPIENAIEANPYSGPTRIEDFPIT